MPYQTLLDVAKMQYADPVVGLVEESLAAAPELSVFAARTIPGMTYKTFVRTGLPAVSFTGGNEGVSATGSVTEQRTYETFILRSAVQIDLAVQNASDGLGLPSLEMQEALGVTQAVLRKLGSQIWYGTTNDAKGFPGIKAFLPKGGATVLDAGGTTANTAASVYFVKFGAQFTQLIFGNNQTLQLSPFSNQQLTDSNGGIYAARVASLTAWTGLQIANKWGVGRICNLTADSGKTLTDSLIAQALAKFQIGYEPDAIFMSRRSRMQLQTSRTVALFGQGAVGPNNKIGLIAPTPVESMGLPIITTDQILETDAIE